MPAGTRIAVAFHLVIVQLLVLLNRQVPRLSPGYAVQHAAQLQQALIHQVHLFSQGIVHHSVLIHFERQHTFRQLTAVHVGSVERHQLAGFREHHRPQPLRHLRNVGCQAL